MADFQEIKIDGMTSHLHITYKKDENISCGHIEFEVGLSNMEINSTNTIKQLCDFFHKIQEKYKLMETSNAE